MLSAAGGLTYGEKRLWVPFPDPNRFLSLEVLGGEFRDRLLKTLEWMHASSCSNVNGYHQSKQPSFSRERHPRCLEAGQLGARIFLW